MYLTMRPFFVPPALGTLCQGVVRYHPLAPCISLLERDTWLGRNSGCLNKFANAFLVTRLCA